MSELLTLSPADVVRRLLVNLGYGTLPGNLNWPINVARELDTPDNTITVYDTSGVLQGRLQPTGVNEEYHGIQVRVRSTVFETGWAKINAIAYACDVLVEASTVVVSSATFVVGSIMRTGSPMWITRDVPTSDRQIFTLNANVDLNQSA